MGKFIDLHTHSIMSDGSMSPVELVNHAKNSGLTAIALTDHDSIDGVEEAVLEGERIGIEVVKGIEFSVQSKTETHILGYDIDIKNKELVSILENVKKVRLLRNKETQKKLNELGFDVTFEEALEIAPNGIVGRAHFARLLAQKGYVSSVKEAFDLYLASGKYAYSSTQLLTAKQAVELIKVAGGKSFVAHLHLIRLSDEGLIDFLVDLKNAGLDGVEGYYTEYTPELFDKYNDIAKKLSLKISGGTDFHGSMKPHIAIGKGLGNLEIPYSVLENIRKN